MKNLSFKIAMRFAFIKKIKKKSLNDEKRINNHSNLSPLTKWYKCASWTLCVCVFFIVVVLLNLESSQCLIGFLFCHRNIFSIFLCVRSIHCSIVFFVCLLFYVVRLKRLVAYIIYKPHQVGWFVGYIAQTN